MVLGDIAKCTTETGNQIRQLLSTTCKCKEKDKRKVTEYEHIAPIYHIVNAYNCQLFKQTLWPPKILLTDVW